VTLAVDAGETPGAAVRQAARQATRTMPRNLRRIFPPLLHVRVEERVGVRRSDP